MHGCNAPIAGRPDCGVLQHPTLHPRSGRAARIAAAAAGYFRSPCGGDTDRGAVTREGRVDDKLRDDVERILASYEDISARFSEVGGIDKLLGLFDDVKQELERVSDHELERVTQEIKAVVEHLLKVDYELRKVQNLKLLFEQRKPEAGDTHQGTDEK